MSAFQLKVFNITWLTGISKWHTGVSKWLTGSVGSNATRYVILLLLW